MSDNKVYEILIKNKEIEQIEADEIEKDIEKHIVKGIKIEMHHMDLFKIFVWMKNIEDRDAIISSLTEQNKEKIKGLRTFIMRFVSDDDGKLQEAVEKMMNAYSDKPYIKKKFDEDMAKHYGEY